MFIYFLDPLILQYTRFVSIRMCPDVPQHVSHGASKTLVQECMIAKPCLISKFPHWSYWSIFYEIWPRKESRGFGSVSRFENEAMSWSTNKQEVTSSCAKTWKKPSQKLRIPWSLGCSCNLPDALLTRQEWYLLCSTNHQLERWEMSPWEPIPRFDCTKKS